MKSLRTVGSWVVAGLILLATLSLASVQAGHKYLPDDPPLYVAEAPCIKPVDLLKRVRALSPSNTFNVQPLFRAEEAKVFGALVGQVGAHTFYAMVNSSDERWIIFAANKAKCVLLLDGNNATEDKFSQVRGQGAYALKQIADFVALLVQEEKQREPTV